MYVKHGFPNGELDREECLKEAVKWWEVIAGFCTQGTDFMLEA